MVSISRESKGDFSFSKVWFLANLSKLRHSLSLCVCVCFCVSVCVWVRNWGMGLKYKGEGQLAHEAAEASAGGGGGGGHACQRLPQGAAERAGRRIRGQRGAEARCELTGG